MSREVIWSRLAIRALQSIPRRDAELIDAAVMRYAATGEGHARKLPEDDATTRRLLVGGYRVRFVANPYEPKLWVLSIYRADR